MIEVTTAFHGYQRCIQAQLLTGGIVLVQYRARAEMHAYFDATVADSSSNGMILRLPEARVQSSRTVTPLIVPALLERGKLSLTAIHGDPHVIVAEQLRATSTRVVLLTRHAKVSREFLSDLVLLSEACSRLGHPVVFVLATSQDTRVLLHREPELECVASIASVPQLGRDEFFELLRFHDYSGDGLATLIRYARGNWGIAHKILSTCAAKASSAAAKTVSRDAIVDAARDLSLEPLIDKVEPADFGSS